IGHVVQEETYRRVMSINEAAAGDAHAPAGSTAQKIGDFWYAAMDTGTIARQGFEPLSDEFARIQAVRDTKGLLEVIAHLQYIGVGALYGNYIFQDEKNS